MRDTRPEHRESMRDTRPEHRESMGYCREENEKQETKKMQMS